MSWSHARRQLIVAAVCILITFVAYTSQIFVLWNFLGGATLHTVFVLAPFNAFVIMIYINYTLVCLTDPGTVPPNWMPDPEAAMEVKRSTHAPRFCKTCKNYKPPRTHHCSTCGRCVLKMDHHCPWISNCVGFANYGHFIRFIVYVEISCIYLFIMLSCRLAQIIRNMHLYNLHPTTVEAVFLAVNLLLSAAAIIIVGILNGYHAFCLTTNTTTIEGWEKGTTLTMKSLGRIRKVKYPYNLGLYRNICAVLGQQPILWLWPQRMKGDGLSFPTKEFDNTSNDDEEIGDDDDEKLYQGHGMDDDFSADDHHHLDHRSSIYTLQTMQGNDNEISEAMSTTSAEEKRQSVVSLPKRVHTRISGATLRVDPSWPTTPASVTTFASSTTLVDSQWKLPTRASKETFELGSSSRRSR